MKKGSFSGRRRDLEEEFFLKRDMELLQALREEAASKERKKALAAASGIADDELLDQLAQQEVTSESLAALSLVPLIIVAWADGNMDVKERDAVLAAARQEGLDEEHPAYRLLQGWLQRKPDPKLLTVWKGYVAALVQTLDETARNTLKATLLGRTRAVAEAAGGLLGFGNKVSKPEQAVLAELEEAFE